MIVVKYDRILGDLREDDSQTGTDNQLLRNEYYYFAQSLTEDTEGDWRMYGDDNGFYFQVCTVGNATKGAGTWVTKFTIDV